MKQLIRLFLNFFIILLRAGIRWVPRNQKKWVFGAKEAFRDNPKYFYYWNVEKHHEIQSIWIGHSRKDVRFLKSKGLSAYYWLSPMGLWNALTAKVYICDHSVADISFLFSAGAFYVNLWHGVSVKKVRWQAPQYYIQRHHLKNESEMKTSLMFRILEYPNLFINPDLLLTPSKSQAEMFFAEMHNIGLEKCVLGIPPRSRLLLSSEEDVMKFIRKYESVKTLELIDSFKQYKKVYIYMPTWRGGGRNFIADAKIDWEILNEALKTSNSLLVLRLHMFTKLDVSDLAKYSNIIVYPKQSDIYTVLPFVDCLITDYSSIYTDFLAMNKEIILFVYDYDKYIAESHSLPDYDKYFLGERANNFEQLTGLISSRKDCHIRKEEYDSIMKFFWDNNEHDIDLTEEIKKRIGLSI